MLNVPSENKWMNNSDVGILWDFSLENGAIH